MTYTAEKATEYGPGAGVNGYGKRVKVTGAFTIDSNGRRVRAFSDKEGGYEAALKWAARLNETM